MRIILQASQVVLQVSIKARNHCVNEKDALLGVLLSSELQKEGVVLGPRDRLSGLWTIMKKLARIPGLDTQ